MVCGTLHIYGAHSKHELPTCCGRGSPKQAPLPSKQGKKTHLLLISNKAPSSHDVTAAELQGLGCGRGRGVQGEGATGCSLLSPGWLLWEAGED